MTPSAKTPWEKIKEKRSANIGFVSRLNAFKEPTPAEKATAMATEINSWQATIKTTPYHLSAEYSIPKGHGFNLLQDTTMQSERIAEAEVVYLTTPMDQNDELKDLGIDVSPYENPPTRLQKIKRMFAHTPWWEDVLVPFLPFVIFAAAYYMVHKLR